MVRKLVLVMGVAVGAAGCSPMQTQTARSTTVTEHSGISTAEGRSAGWGVQLVDWDNDGDDDLAIVSGGMLKGGEKEVNALYENRDGRLVNVTRELGAEVKGAAFGSAWADYDNDGDLDWLIVNSKKNSVLLENRAASGNYLKVKLNGTGANRDAVGARLKLTSGGRTQVKTILAGKGYASSEELIVQFGLGGQSEADLLKVSWPGGGAQTTLHGLKANRTIVINQ
jgi:enediyne biosynthesis protein E4